VWIFCLKSAKGAWVKIPVVRAAADLGPMAVYTVYIFAFSIRKDSIPAVIFFCQEENYGQKKIMDRRKLWTENYGKFG
jgi:hypothetical protein